MKEVLEKAHYHEAYTRAYDIEVCQNGNGVEILAYTAVVAATVQKNHGRKNKVDSRRQRKSIF